ncbi:DoxX family protein [Microvirga vignae]|uniref:DoxX family protein n=1 Tax=Microvirga vignae TaxID=1225564 RepID=UPI00069C3732|nr:DoxX family protein [Microvirga vignae]
MANLIGPESMRKKFVAWDFPSSFNLANGAIQLTAAVLPLMDGTRVLGLHLGLLVAIGVIVTMVRNREFGHLPPGVILLGVVLVDLWGSLINSWRRVTAMADTKKIDNAVMAGRAM